MNKQQIELLSSFTALFTFPESDYMPQNDFLWTFQSSAEDLAAFYNKIPFRFPVLYEELLLNFRWAQAEISDILLLANVPSANFDGLLSEIFKDQMISETTLGCGFVQIGKKSFGCYDPICFDFSNTNYSLGIPIVQLDHEKILLKQRCIIVNQIADSFQSFVESAVNQS